jgi:hypothetical protein
VGSLETASARPHSQVARGLGGATGRETRLRGDQIRPQIGRVLSDRHQRQAALRAPPERPVRIPAKGDPIAGVKRSKLARTSALPGITDLIDDGSRRQGVAEGDIQARRTTESDHHIFDPIRTLRILRHSR